MWTESAEARKPIYPSTVADTPGALISPNFVADTSGAHDVNLWHSFEGNPCPTPNTLQVKNRALPGSRGPSPPAKC